jgi:hypothetical protein
VSTLSSRALVLLRVPRGSTPPDDDAVRAAIRRDQARLGVSAGEPGPYRLAGPYAIELDGRALDEYVAWEV